MATNKTICEIAVQYNKAKHPTYILSEFKFIVTEQICNPDDKHNFDRRLLAREAFMCAQLCSLQRYYIRPKQKIGIE